MNNIGKIKSSEDLMKMTEFFLIGNGSIEFNMAEAFHVLAKENQEFKECITLLEEEISELKVKTRGISRIGDDKKGISVTI
jgi:hypothetical protein